MAGHFVALAPFLVESDPEAPALDIDIFDAHLPGRGATCANVKVNYVQSAARPPPLRAILPISLQRDSHNFTGISST